MKSGLTTHDDGQSGDEWLSDGEMVEDGNEASGRISSGHGRDQDASSWDCVCPEQSRAAELDAESASGSGINFGGEVLILGLPCAAGPSCGCLCDAECFSGRWCLALEHWRSASWYRRHQRCDM